MQKILYLFFSLFLIKAKAQEGPGLNKKETVEIEPVGIIYSKKLPFNQIKIIDSRCDTSRIGYYLRRKKYGELSFSGSSKTILENILNKSLESNLDKAQESKLVIVIKNLWLQDARTNSMIDFTAEEKNINGSENLIECISKFEIYLETMTGFTPLLRMDSTYLIVGSLPFDGKKAISEPFLKCLGELEKINFAKASGSLNKLSFQQIENYNLERFNKPIFAAFNLPTGEKGIYPTYEDFLYDRKLKLTFEVETGKTDQLYLVNGTEKKLMNEFWGYSDGTKYYINGGYNFYQLSLKNKCFEYVGNPIPIFYMDGGNKVPPNSAHSTLGSLLYMDNNPNNRPVLKKNIPILINPETGQGF